MAIFPTSEDYNGLVSLYENAGNWVEGELTFTNRFDRYSSTNDPVTFKTLSGIHWLEYQTGDWGDFGFVAGDNIIIGYSTTQPNVINSTVTYVNGNKLYISTALSSGTVVYPSSGIGVMSVIADKLPDSLEFYFNLTQQNANNLSSLIDGELQRFELQNMQSSVIGVPQLMTQLGNQSGGYLTDVYLTWLSYNSTQYTRNFRITYKFWDWGIIKDGIEPPPYYDNTDHLAPICGLKAFSVYGNPNGVNEANTTNLLANTGFFDENYNGGNNPNTLTSISWLDYLGNPITALDYSNNCTFTAVVETTNQNNPNSTYSLGLVWRPIDGTQYQNLPNSIAENLMLLAPEVDFIANGVQDTNTYTGFTHPTGAQWDLTNVTFTLVGNTLTIEGEIQPNTLATTLFAGIPAGGRKSTMWVSIGDYTKDGTTQSDRVNFRLFDEDNIDAPTLGVQIPDVVSESLLDHGSIDILTPEPQTTTEDDVLYKSEFRLIDNLAYEGVRAVISAYNTSSGDEFILEDTFFSFTNVPYISGQYQPNFTNNRGFNLPPTTDRNWISLIRKPSLDISGKYGVELQYGYLSRWEYWLAQNNVDNFFFNSAEPLNGKNKDWERFYDTGNNWKLRISYFTRLAGVDDFNHFDLGIRPYEDDVTVSTAVTFTVLSTGATPSQLVANELIEVQCVFTLSSGVWSNEWVEHTIENFESGNRWVISSVLPQGGIAQNPLKPISTATGVDVTGSGTAVLTTKSVVDTNLLNVNKVSMSFRVYSEELNFMIDQEAKLPKVAYSLRKVTSPTFYTGACIRVRRSSDDAEQDIGFNGMDLDVASLESFCAGTDGFVTTWYDQSGNTNNATRTIASSQPKIVSSGTAITDPDNGKVAMLFDGTNDQFNISTPFNSTQVFMNSFVFNRPTATDVSVGICNDGVAYPFPMYWRNNGDLYGRMTNGGNATFETGSSLTDDFHVMSYRDNADLATTRLNGSAATSSPITYGLGTASSMDAIGNRTGNYHSSYMQELIHWITDQQINLSAYETDTNTYWGIY